MILDSSMVEHSAVNRVVVGSSPTRGAKAAKEMAAEKIPQTQSLRDFYLYKDGREEILKGNILLTEYENAETVSYLSAFHSPLPKWS